MLGVAPREVGRGRVAREMGPRVTCWVGPRSSGYKDRVPVCTRARGKGWSCREVQGRNPGVEGFKGQGQEYREGVCVGSKMVMGSQNWKKRPGYAEE